MKICDFKDAYGHLQERVLPSKKKCAPTKGSEKGRAKKNKHQFFKIFFHFF